jgi:hypothetical protein
VKSVDGFNSFITFTYDYSRYGYIYLIKERNEVLDKFKIFKVEVENQHNLNIKVVWCKVQMARGGVNSLFKILQASLNNHVSIKRWLS